MPKGYQGQSCADAIKECFIEGDQIRSFSEIMQAVKKKGAWQESTIWQHLMSTVVNIIPARYQWKVSKRFLFLRPDGQYEIYNKLKHPKPIE